MELHLYRPRGERVLRFAIASAMLIASALLLFLADLSSRAVLVFVVSAIVSVPVLSGAVRPVAIAARRGLGIVGVIPAEIHWFSWLDIMAVQVVGSVLSFEATDRAIYQLRMEPRAASFVKRMAALRPSRGVTLEQITRP